MVETKKVTKLLVLQSARNVIGCLLSTKESKVGLKNKYLKVLVRNLY